MGFAVGRDAGGKDVVTWSSSLIPACFCWQLTVKGGEKAFLAPGVWAQARLPPRLRVCWPQLPLKILVFIGADKQELIN